MKKQVTMSSIIKNIEELEVVVDELLIAHPINVAKKTIIAIKAYIVEGVDLTNNPVIHNDTLITVSPNNNYYQVDLEVYLEDVPRNAYGKWTYDTEDCIKKLTALYEVLISLKKRDNMRSVVTNNLIKELQNQG